MPDRLRLLSLLSLAWTLESLDLLVEASGDVPIADAFENFDLGFAAPDARVPIRTARHLRASTVLYSQKQ